MEDRGGAGGGGDHRRRVALPHADGQAGFTLIELVIAVSIFAIMTAGIAATINSGLTLSRNNRNRSVAANLAAEQMDNLRSMDFATLQAQLGTKTTSKAVGDSPPYTISTTVAPVPVNSTVGPCDAQGGATNDLVFRVDVTVSWPDMRGVTTGPLKTAAAKATTIISPPVGVYNTAGLGFVGVKVLASDASPLGRSIPVTLTGTSGSPSTIQTDPSTGCAFFSSVTPGAYTVALGFDEAVDRQGNASPTQTIGVSANAITQVGFDYDLASTLNLTITGAGGATVPSTVAVTLGDSDFQPSGTKVFTGGGTSRVIGNLFPTKAGYTAWAGDCADADPQGSWSNGSYWSGAQRAAPADVSPGGTTAYTVQMPAAQVSVQQAGLPLAGVDVQAVHQLPSGLGTDAGCPGGETFDLGITDASGNVAAALPYGLWKIQVAGRTPNPSWPTATLDATLGAVTTAVTVQVQ